MQKRPDGLFFWCRSDTEYGVLATHTERVHQPIDALRDHRLPLLGGGSLDEPLGPELDAYLVEERALRERSMRRD